MEIRLLRSMRKLSHFGLTSRLMALMAITLFSMNNVFAGPIECGTGCFDTEIVSVNEVESCKEYTLKVSYSGECQYYGLSHFTVGIPCGEVVNATNSEGWPMELNMTDPTTGIYGFKVDNIEGFGEGNAPQEFIVKFTLCADDAACEEELSCWAPTVAYKSGQCVDLETLEINCNTLNGAVVPTDESCFGAKDGRAEVIVDGGTAPFSFLWSNGSTNQNLEGVSAGDYAVTITDANGQEITLNTTITGPSAIMVDGTTTGASCNGVENGSISLAVSGGVPPYSYAWSNGEESQQIDSLAAGAYSVTVTDGNGCTAVRSFAVTTSNAIKVLASGSNIKCGASNGTIDLTVTGGTGSYTFNWSNGATTEDLEGLSAGWYSVKVEDDNGCTAVAMARVAEEILQFSSATTMPTCNGGENGSIDLTMTSGVPEYEFQWSTGDTTEDVSGLSKGLYTVTIIDGVHCTRTASFYISEPRAISGDISLKDFQCGETPSGTLDLSVSGGASPYSFAWSTGDTTQNIAVTAEGTYQVTITDKNGCTSMKQFVFELPEQPLSLTTVKTDLNCNGSASGAIDLTVTGGKAPYTYQWSNGASGEDLQGLSGGTYSVTVTDDYGCSASATISIEEPVAQGCAIVSPSAEPVTGSTGNLLRTDIEGAVQYEWTVNGSGWTVDSGQGTAEITYTAGVAGGDTTAVFTLTIIYSNGCQETCSISIQNSGNDTGDGDPDDGNPDDGNPDDGNPDDGNPDDGNPDDGNPDDGNPDDGNPDDGNPDDGNPDDGNPDDGNPDDGNPDDGNPDDGNPDDGNPDDGNPDDGNPDDGNPDDGNPDDGNPDDGNPDDGNPDDGNPDDGDPDDGNPDDGDKTCVDCFETEIISSNKTGECSIYTMEISSDGRCRYDLSHFTVAIPCGKVSNVSNSEGWEIEYGQDPTTGLYGFKVDDIPGFGKGQSGESFTVTFTLCPEDDICKNKLTCWEPIVAYKAGQCVFYDDLETVCDNLNQLTVAKEPVSAVAYPNPFLMEATIEFAVEEDSHVTVELYSMYGRKVAVLFDGSAEKYLIHKVKIDGDRFREDYYIYKIITPKGIYTGKIFRKQ